MKKAVLGLTLAATALLLSACGDTDTPPAAETDTQATEQATQNGEAAQQANTEDQQRATEQEGGTSQDEKAQQEETSQTSTPPSSEPADTSSAQEAAENNAGNEINTEEVEAGTDTLNADPSEALEEEGGLPGEASASDVDDFIAENERRFEEAQKRLEAQFEEVESQTFEPGDTSALDDSIDMDWESRTDWDTANDQAMPDSSIDDEQLGTGEMGADDIQSTIDDTEQQFREAQERIEQQFEEYQQPSSTVEEGAADTSRMSSENEDRDGRAEDSDQQ